MAFCPVANASDSKRFHFLLRFYDLNETAFSYHRLCLSNKGAINENFLGTLEFVADELFSQAKKDDPRVDPEYIKEKILKRRRSIQYRLYQVNQTQGCRSPATEKARAHYEEFSRYNRAEIAKFINDQTADG